MTLVVPGFHYFQGSYLIIHETIVFLSKFSHSIASILDNVINFYKPKKVLSSPVFTIKTLMAEIFGCY